MTKESHSDAISGSSAVLKYAHLERERRFLLPKQTFKLGQKIRLNSNSPSTLAIDEFAGQLAGLTLSEVDLAVADSMLEPLPVEVAAEVTNDERFSHHELR